MSESTALAFQVRTDTLLRFLENDYETVRLVAHDPANGYWLANFRPEESAPIDEWVDPDDEDGQYPVEGSRTYDNGKVTMTMHIQGDSPADLAAKRMALYAEVKRRALLEYRPPNWEHSLVYTVFPYSSMDPSQWFTPAIQENNRIVGLRIELQALPWSEAAGEMDEMELVGGTLGENDDWEDRDGDEFRGWSKTTTGSATVTADTTNYLTGAVGCRFTVNGDSAQMADDGFIGVGASLYYNIQTYIKRLSGTIAFYITILCYDEAESFLGSISVFNQMITASGWLDLTSHDPTRTGIIMPASFPAGTVKVKRQFKAEGAGSLVIDRILFCQTDRVIEHRSAGLMAIDIPAGDVGGEVETPCDFIISPVYAPFTHAFIGRRQLYDAGGAPESGAFNPIRNDPGEGSLAHASKRHRDGYRVLDISENLIVEDPGFAVTTGSGNATEWTYWVEQRSSGAYMAGDDGVVNIIGPDYRSTCNVGLTALNSINVDSSKTHYLGLRAQGPGALVALKDAPTYVEALCYDNESNLLGIVRTYRSILPYTFPDFVLFGGLITPEGTGNNPFPVGTVKVKPRARVFKLNSSAPWQLWDMFYMFETPWLIQCEFSVEHHRGRYLPVFGFGASGPITQDDDVFLMGKTAWEGAQYTVDQYRQLTRANLHQPDEAFREVALFGSDRFSEITIPSTAVPDEAVPNTMQDFALQLSPLIDGTKDIHADYFALIPTCGAFLEVADFPEGQDMIVDSTSNYPRVLASKPGMEKDYSKVLDSGAWSPKPRFTLSPGGTNLVFHLLRDNEGEHESWCVARITARYRRRHHLTSEG